MLAKEYWNPNPGSIKYTKEKSKNILSELKCNYFFHIGSWCGSWFGLVANVTIGVPLSFLLILSRPTHRNRVRFGFYIRFPLFFLFFSFLWEALSCRIWSPGIEEVQKKKEAFAPSHVCECVPFNVIYEVDQVSCPYNSIISREFAREHSGCLCVMCVGFWYYNNHYVLYNDRIFKMGHTHKSAKHSLEYIHMNNHFQFFHFLCIRFAFLGAGLPESLRPIIVHEGEHLRLRCAATGNPRPHVEWRRVDGKTISVGAWQGKSFAR